MFRIAAPKMLRAISGIFREIKRTCIIRKVMLRFRLIILTG